MPKWGRSDAGYVTSKCGYWQICPLYWGCVNPQSYELRHNGKKVEGWFATQRDAKEAADRIEERDGNEAKEE